MKRLLTRRVLGLPAFFIMFVLTLGVGLPAVATTVAHHGTADVAVVQGHSFTTPSPGVHLELGKRPTQAQVDAADLVSCAPWGHPECVIDFHPPGNYFQPLCSCNNGPAFQCCNGHGQPCA